MIAYYLTMFLENSLLATVSLGSMTVNTPWFYHISVWVVWIGFGLGLLSCLLYYNYFHSRHIQADLLRAAGLDSSIHGNNLNTRQPHVHSGSSLPPPYSSLVQQNHCHNNHVEEQHNRQNNHLKQQSEMKRNETGLHHPGCSRSSLMPIGVFSCRLNPLLGNNRELSNVATKSSSSRVPTSSESTSCRTTGQPTASKRKKKKPSSFVPPPLTTAVNAIANQECSNNLVDNQEAVADPAINSGSSTSLPKEPQEEHHQQEVQQQEKQHAIHPSTAGTSLSHQDCISDRNHGIRPTEQKIDGNSTRKVTSFTRVKKKGVSTTITNASLKGPSSSQSVLQEQQEKANNNSNSVTSFMKQSIGNKSLLDSGSLVHHPSLVGHLPSLSGSGNAITQHKNNLHQHQLNHIQQNQQQDFAKNNFDSTSVIPSDCNVMPMSIALPTRRMPQHGFSSALSTLFQATNSIHNKIAATGIGITSRGNTSNFGNSMPNSRPQVQSARLFESRRNEDPGLHILNGRHSCNIWQHGNHQSQHHLHNNSMIFRSAMSQGNLTTRLTPVHTIVHSTAPSTFLKKMPSVNILCHDKVADSVNNGIKEVQGTNLDLIQEQLNRQQKQDKTTYNINDPEHNRRLIKQKLLEKRQRELKTLQSVNSGNQANYSMMGRSSVPVGHQDAISSHGPPVPPNRPQLVHPIPFPAQVFGGYKSIAQHNNRRHHPRRSKSSSRVTPDMYYDFPPGSVLNQHRKQLHSSHSKLDVLNQVRRPGYFTPHVGFPSPDSNGDNHEDDYGTNKSLHHYYEAADVSLKRSDTNHKDHHHYSKIKSVPCLALESNQESSPEEGHSSGHRLNLKGSDHDEPTISFVDIRQVSLSVPSAKRSRKPIRLANISPTELDSMQDSNHHHVTSTPNSNHNRHDNNHYDRNHHSTILGNHHNSSDDADVDSDAARKSDDQHHLSSNATAKEDKIRASSELSPLDSRRKARDDDKNNNPFPDVIDNLSVNARNRIKRRDDDKTRQEGHQEDKKSPPTTANKDSRERRHHLLEEEEQFNPLFSPVTSTSVSSSHSKRKLLTHFSNTGHSEMNSSSQEIDTRVKLQTGHELQQERDGGSSSVTALTQNQSSYSQDGKQPQPKARVVSSFVKMKWRSLLEKCFWILENVQIWERLTTLT